MKIEDYCSFLPYFDRYTFLVAVNAIDGIFSSFFEMGDIGDSLRQALRPAAV